MSRQPLSAVVTTLDNAATLDDCLRGLRFCDEIVLEILSETGFIGLGLWLMGAALAVRAWRWALPAARSRSAVAALALAVTAFPLNTSLAFYSNFWGGVFLLLLALFAGALFALEDDEGAKADSPEAEPAPVPA